MTDYLRFEIGEDALGIIPIVIGILHDRSSKCEYEKNRHRFKLDRIRYSTGRFPTDYNFIPQMRGDDGNPRDSLMLGELLTFPHCVYDAPPTGPFPPIDPGALNKNLCTCQGKSPPPAAQQNTSVASHIV